MFRNKSIVVLLLLAFWFPLLSVPVQAHHSNANYDQTKTVTLKGTVVDYDWGNPHVIMVWDVKGADGKVVRWESFLASVETELANGLRKNTFKPGDSVIMTVHAAKDGSPHSVAAEVRKGDGTVVCAPCVGQHAGGGAAHPYGVE